MRHLLCTSLLLLGCLVLPAALEAGEVGLDDYSSEPQAFRSTPPRDYRDDAPQTFEVVAERHVFRGAELPRVAETRPVVLIRSYDADTGVYRDIEVRDREPEVTR